MPGGTRSKSSSKYYLLNMVFLSKSYMIAFILGALGTQKEGRGVDTYDIRSQGPCWSWGWARGQNLVHLFESVFLKNTHQKAFMLG